MKNLAIFLTTTGFGGLELNTLNLAQWLNQTYRVHLILNQDARLMDEAQKTGLACTGLKQPKKYFDFSAAKQLAQLLKNLQTDTVLLIDNRDIDVVAISKRLFYKDLRIIYQQQMQIGVPKKDWLHSIRFKAIDTWITPLKWLKDEIASKTHFPLDRVQIIPLCQDTERFLEARYTKAEARKKLNIGANVTLLGIMGRISYKKGQHVLLKALPQIRKTHPEVELVIFGEATIDDAQAQEYANELRQFVNNNKLNEVVHFRSFSNDTAQFYNAIDFFGMASSDETFGMVTIEAMLSGVPIIGANAKGTAELLENGKLGHLFNPNDAYSFAQSTLEALNQPEETARKAEQAKITAAKKYNHHVQTEGFLQIIG